MGQHIGANRRSGFDCKLVNEVQMQRVRGRDTVQVYRGAQRETWSCTPNCERRITLGDSAEFFTAIAGQAEARNGAATTGGAAATKAAR